MTDFVDKHKIINKEQFEFQKKTSATDEVLELAETVPTKAFNSISHNIFLKKVKMYGFSQEEKEILFLFLANRRQKVKLNGMFSDCEILNHGVPHGIVLGPLNFLLYVNDFSSNINTTHNVFQFADDTSIVCCGQKSSLHEKSWKFYRKQKNM